MVTPLILAALLAAPAQAAEAPADPPKRIRSVVLYGEETCPKAETQDEIVVCARAGDSPYRIPEKFREPPPETGPSNSWVRRVETMDEVNRVGLPGSCSAVGTGGQTGCTMQMLRQWAEEKKAQEREGASVP